MPDFGRGSPAQFAALADPKLLACRDIALQLLLQSFDGFFSRLENDFFELAEKSSERSLREIYFAARAETLAKRGLIKAEFRQQFLDAFDQRLQELESEERGVRYLNKDEPKTELSLVANEEYEENLTVSSMASAFKLTGGEDLRQMESRLARLVPGKAEQNAANPICPEAICEAMLRACRQIESGVEARIVALRAFESQLTQQVGGIYRQVNEFLVQQNVQPVSYKSHPQPTSGYRPPRREDPPPASATPSENPSVTAGAAPLSPGLVNMMVPAALAAHLERLLSGSAQQAPQTAVQSATEFSFLNQLQHRLPEDPVALEGETLLPASGNLISLLQTTQWAQGLAQMDAMTLNLVALLFDRLFEDSRLPEAIKGLIGRLQIPVLKVALLDSAFFSRKQHPARQLLDRLAEAAIDWHDDADAGNPRFDKLSAIVTWIVVNFEDDVGIFDQALVDLESFLLAEADAATSQIQDDAQELAVAELNELGLATAESLVGARLFKRDVPALVDEFVRRWWVPALAKVYGVEGENEPRFVAYVTALDDLLWSVEPKRGAEERLQLVNCLPRMLKTLEEGTAEAGMAAQEWQAFMSELVHCHASAIRNGMRPPSAAPVFAPAVAEVAAPIPEPVYELPPVLLEELPKRWAWVDLQEEDGSHHKLRLTWISPQGTRFLFTNRVGANGHTFTRTEIETLIRNGRLRHEDWSGSLTDGVFDELRHTLSA
ncbi:MAG: hypothetical protein H6R07_754 [Proteobacteria bacterium]|nr:hypothetical protein [Pseudomonadota bacterium]